MAHADDRPLKLFQFPRPAMFDVPNLSPFCCKLETWLRMNGVPYEIVDTPDPRKAPKGKLPFIDDDGKIITDSSMIVDHLARSRDIDPDAHLTESERAIALLVQRTLEEHYAFVVLYTHFIRDEGWRHTRATFDRIPLLVRLLAVSMVRKHMKRLLWTQGLTRRSDADIMEAAIRDWRAVLAFMSNGPFYFGARPSTVDAIVFGALATTVLTEIQSPIRDFLRSQPRAMDYAQRLRFRFFPDLCASIAESARAAA